MQPLGLGSGSGLGDQGVKMCKSSSSKSSIARTEATTEPQKWGVNARNEKGQTNLHFASRMTSSGIAGSLLQAGADVNARDGDGFTPLHVAATHGQHQTVKLLIEHGANALLREQAGQTPRELAVKIRDEIIQAQETLINDGSCKLKFAEASRGEMDSIIHLLTDAESKSVDVAAQETIPASAAEESRPIAQRANFHKLMTALHSAALGNALTVACRGDVDFLQLLLFSGAHADFRSSDGATPLLAASDGGFANCVQLLLEHGANANASDKIGITPLIAAAYNGHVECLRVLLKHGASINTISRGGVSPLIAAAEGRGGDCIQVLIQAGAQINSKTDEGKTALLFAVSKNCVEAAETLLNAGADIDATDVDGCSALHYGARGNSVGCLRLLLERGADETRKCRTGQTPLQEARKDSEGAKLLEDSWKKLELEIAMRAEELLNEEKQEHKSSTSKKLSTRLSREKKNVKNRKKKKQGAVEKAVDAKEELEEGIIEAKAEDKHVLAVDVSSPSGTEFTMEQASPTLGRGSSASDRSMHITRGVQVFHGDPPGISPEVEELTIPAPFPAGEDNSENPDKWIRVDGKRTVLKPSSPQPKPQGISITGGLSPLRGSSGSSSKSGEAVSPGADFFSTERKMLSGLKMLSKEDDSKDGESSTWVQAVLGRSHSSGDGLNPCSKSPLRRTHTHEVGPSPINMTPSEARAGDGTEKEKLIERMQRIELELEQARQAERTMMEKVKQLEILREENSVKMSEMAQSLSRAHYQVEITKNEMQVRIYDLEAVVSSRTEALQIAQAEYAMLKLQMQRKEVQATEHERSRVAVPSVSGMVRSASESSLHSMGCGTEPRSPLEILPFIPKAGPKTEKNNWFSLVPSPD